MQSSIIAPFSVPKLTACQYVDKSITNDHLRLRFQSYTISNALPASRSIYCHSDEHRMSRLKRKKELKLKETVCSLRVAESLLARTCNGFRWVQGGAPGGRNGLRRPGGSIFSAECSALPLVAVTQLLSHQSAGMRGDHIVNGNEQVHDDVLEILGVNVLDIQMEIAIERELRTVDLAAAGCYPAIPARFEIANRILRRMEEERAGRRQGDEWREMHPTALDSLNTSPRRQGGTGSIEEKMQTSSAAFSYIFSILICDRKGAVGLLEGGDFFKGLKLLFDTCVVFEEMWITPLNQSSAENTLQSGKTDANGHVGVGSRGVNILRDGKAAKESLSSMIISFCSSVETLRPHQKDRQKQQKASRGYRKESRISGVIGLRGDALLLALQYYRRKSEAAHTIARRARGQIAVLTEALKVAKIAESACTANMRGDEELNNKENVPRTATNTATDNPLCTSQGGSKSISFALDSWKSAIELSKGILHAIWREVLQAALLAPVLLTEAVRLILSASDCLDTDIDADAVDDGAHYPKVLIAFLQLWVGCSVGGEDRMSKAQLVSIMLAPLPPVVLSKDDLHSPASSWASVTDHVRQVLSQQPQYTVLTGSGVALVLALHTYVLASSPQSGGVVPTPLKISEAPILCGAWDLMKALCCNPRVWGGGECPDSTVWERKNELSGFQLMSLSIATRVCRLWVGAERNAVPLYTHTASSVLTMEESLPALQGEEGSGLVVVDGSKSCQDSGSKVNRALPWGFLRENRKIEKVEEGELSAIKATASALEWSTQGPRPFQYSDGGGNSASPSPVSIGALSLFMTSQAVQSSASPGSSGNVSHSRAYLQNILAQLSSCIFSELGLQSPIRSVHGIKDTKSAGLDDFALDQNIRKQLQLYFSKAVSADEMACSTVTLLSQLLHKMLCNIVIVAAEKTTAAFNTRLRTNCSTALCDLLDMSRIATRNSGSQVPLPTDASTLPSMTECVCLCLAVRAVSDTVPLGRSIFRRPFPSSSSTSIKCWESLDSAASSASGGTESFKSHRS
jgi:hypothetical protein